MILEPFYPKEWVDSTYEIDWEDWKEKGKRELFLTSIIPWCLTELPADERALLLFRRLHGLGFQTLLLSNNKEPRVKSFAEQVHSPYIYKAGKPGVRNYNRAVQQMGLAKEEVLFVGDQLFTDVYGANRAGIYGILVKPSTEGRDPDCIEAVSGGYRAVLL